VQFIGKLNKHLCLPGGVASYEKYTKSVIPAKAGIQTFACDGLLQLVALHWIAAFAGMTR
jgi:hypothetical protein